MFAGESLGRICSYGREPLQRRILDLVNGQGTETKGSTCQRRKPSWSPAARDSSEADTCIELLQAGYGVVVVDDLSNSSEKAIERVRSIVAAAAKEGKAPADAAESLVFYEDNVLDRAALDPHLRCA